MGQHARAFRDERGAVIADSLAARGVFIAEGARFAFEAVAPVAQGPGLVGKGAGGMPHAPQGPEQIDRGGAGGFQAAGGRVHGLKARGNVRGTHLLKGNE